MAAYIVVYGFAILYFAFMYYMMIRKTQNGFYKVGMMYLYYLIYKFIIL